MTTTGEKHVTQKPEQTSEQPSKFALDGLAAMRRAAIKARRRAIETQGYVATWRNGRIEHDTEV